MLTSASTTRQICVWPTGGMARNGAFEHTHALGHILDPAYIFSGYPNQIEIDDAHTQLS